MAISITASEMERGKASLVSCGTNAMEALERLKAENVALFAAWQGTGASGFQAAASTVEDALGKAGATLASVGTQVGTASDVFVEADASTAKTLQGLG